MNTCKNCGHPFDLDYCNRCGQKASVKRIEMKWLLHELPHAIWHVEKGFFYNVKQLFIRPGHAIRDFLEGKRKYFFNPLSYLAIMILFNYLVMRVVNFHTYDEKELLNLSAERIKEIKDYDIVNWWIMSHAYLFMLIAVPLTGIFLYLLLRIFKIKYNLAENVIIALFIIAQGTLIQSIVYLLTGWIHIGIVIRTAEFVNTNILWAGFNAFVIYQLINPYRNKTAVAILAIIAGEFIIKLLWWSAEWMAYLVY